MCRAVGAECLASSLSIPARGWAFFFCRIRKAKSSCEAIHAPAESKVVQGCVCVWREADLGPCRVMLVLWIA